MALNKEIIFDSGVKIKYHKITNIFFENNITRLIINCYTDESYREKEKTNKQRQDRYNELINKITKENEKTEKQRDTVKVIEWSEEANKLASSFVDNLDLKVLAVEKRFENITDSNMNNLYSILKKEEMFIDSTDI